MKARDRGRSPQAQKSASSSSQSWLFPVSGTVVIATVLIHLILKTLYERDIIINSILNLFIYLFLAVLGLRFCARALSSCGERGPLFIAVRGPLTTAASPAAEHRLQTRRLSSCGSRTHLLRGTWDLPRPGLEPVSPALAGGFSTTVPPGKP